MWRRSSNEDVIRQGASMRSTLIVSTGVLVAVVAVARASLPRDQEGITMDVVTDGQTQCPNVPCVYGCDAGVDCAPAVKPCAAGEDCPSGVKPCVAGEPCPSKAVIDYRIDRPDVSQPSVA